MLHSVCRLGKYNATFRLIFHMLNYTCLFHMLKFNLLDTWFIMSLPRLPTTTMKQYFSLKCQSRHLIQYLVMEFRNAQFFIFNSMFNVIINIDDNGVGRVYLYSVCIFFFICVPPEDHLWILKHNASYYYYKHQ